MVSTPLLFGEFGKLTAPSFATVSSVEAVTAPPVPKHADVGMKVIEFFLSRDGRGWAGSPAAAQSREQRTIRRTMAAEYEQLHPLIGFRFRCK